MPIKEFEGAKWIPVSEHEEALAAVTREKTDAKGRVTQLERELATAKEKGATADGAAAEIAELRKRLEGAEARYERHVAISQLGITDPDVIETIEWQYERANGKLNKKDQRSLADTLAAWTEDPATAPSSIRHHFEAGGAGEGAGAEGAQGADATAGADAAANKAGGANDAAAGGGGNDAAAAAKKQPPRPARVPAKPGPQGRPVTLDDIYNADDKGLDELVKQFHGQASG